MARHSHYAVVPVRRDYGGVGAYPADKLSQQNHAFVVGWRVGHQGEGGAGEERRLRRIDTGMFGSAHRMAAHVPDVFR